MNDAVGQGSPRGDLPPLLFDRLYEITVCRSCPGSPGPYGVTDEDTCHPFYRSICEALYAAQEEPKPMQDDHSLTLAELATDPQLSSASRAAVLAAIEELDRLEAILTYVRDVCRANSEPVGELASIYDRVIDFDAP